MKSRMIALALFTLFAVGALSTSMRTGSAGSLAAAPTEHINPSNLQRRAPAEGSFCGTPTVADAGGQKLEGAPWAFKPGLAAPVQAGSITIPVYFHVISEGIRVSDGNVPESVLDKQITVLNRAFSGQTGGANTSFRFSKAGISRTINSAWYRMGRASNEELAAKTALRMDAPYVLNFYTILGDNLPAWASFPQYYGAAAIMDGVVIPYTMLPDGTRPSFNAGDIAVHEIGHWLGLYHTFENGCTEPGDHVADTPPHVEPSSSVGICPTTVLDTCSGGGVDPIHNFMQDTSDACKYEFTPGQSARMDSLYYQFRQPTAFPTASVAWVQPSEYTWGPPNTMTVAGYAQDGFGGVEMVWRDTTAGGGENVAVSKPTPDPGNHTWTNTINSPYRCHNYSVYVNYAGVRSQTFFYDGMSSGYCNETARVIWIQPYSTPGVGSPGSLIVAGSAENAPGYQVHMWYRDATAGGNWVLHPYAPLTDSNNIWMNEIPNANYSHVYEVQVTYDMITSPVCTYAGQNSISWCQ